MDGELTYQAWATNYENELPKIKPCPFCGGENVETSYKDTFSGDFRRGVYCADCCGGVYPYYDTEAEAVEAWNTRAERTCELTLDGTDGCFGCSECDENIPPLANYCPNCGAKVVSE